MQKSVHVVFKGVNWVHNDKMRSNSLEIVIWVHNATKIRSYGLERSQLGTICKTNNNI